MANLDLSLVSKAAMYAARCILYAPSWGCSGEVRYHGCRVVFARTARQGLRKVSILFDNGVRVDAVEDADRVAIYSGPYRGAVKQGRVPYLVWFNANVRGGEANA